MINLNHLLMMCLMVLALAVFGDPQIIGSIRLKGRRYIKGDEEELRAVMTPEQQADWTHKGLIAGDWGGTHGAASASESEALLALAERLQDIIDIDRGADEAPQDYIARVIEVVGTATEAQEVSAALRDLREPGEVGPTDVIRRIVDTADELSRDKASLTSQLSELREKFQTLESDRDGLLARVRELEAPKEGFAIFEGIDKRALDALRAGGFDTLEKIMEGDTTALTGLPYVTDNNLPVIRQQIQAHFVQGAQNTEVAQG